MPAVHLWSQARAPLEWDETSRAFRPQDSRPPLLAVGSVNGASTLDAAFADAMSAVRQVLAHAGKPDELLVARPTVQEAPLSAEVGVPPRAGGRSDRQWLDYQHDVTLADVEIARQEGYEHIELTEALHDLRHGGWTRARPATSTPC